VVFVSHDRYFIDHLATRVFEIEAGKVTVYPGNYEDYLWRKAGGGQAAPVTGLNGRPAAQAGPASAPKAPEKRVNPLKLEKMEQQRKALEQEVARLEAEIAGYETQLSNFVSAEQTQRTAELLESRRADLRARMAEWEKVAESIEAMS
jgi:ATP-binding cassette, subfamily F, member 3